MPYGMGDLLAGAMGGSQLNNQIAQQITPDPSPLAQQGGAPDGSSQQAQQGFARPAVTQQDPTVGNLAAMLMRKSEMARAAEGFNRGTGEMASAFGTAQQQASKKAALGAGGGGANPLGDVGDIMKIQQDVTTQNEHARFMANAGVLAKIIGMPVDQTTELMNDPGALQKALATTFSNQTKTEAVKNWEQGRAALRATGKSEAEIDATMPPEMLAYGGGTDISQTQYLQAKALAASQGKTDFPDFETWKEQHKQAATETEDAHKMSMQLPGLKSQLDSMQTQADSIKPEALKGIFGDVSKQTAANAIFNWDPSKGGPDPATLYGNGRALTDEEVTAITNLRQLHLANYASNFKNALPGQRLSQQEALRLGNAADQLGNFSGTLDDYMGRIDAVKSRIGHAMTNAHGEARNLDGLPIQYRSKIDPSFLEGPDALKNLPSWAQPKAVNSQEDLDAIPYGQAYKPGPAFGKYAGKILFKGQESGYEDY